jgi:hypothetical protein
MALRDASWRYLSREIPALRLRRKENSDTLYVVRRTVGPITEVMGFKSVAKAARALGGAGVDDPEDPDAFWGGQLRPLPNGEGHWVARRNSAWPGKWVVERDVVVDNVPVIREISKAVSLLGRQVEARSHLAWLRKVLGRI